MRFKFCAEKRQQDKYIKYIVSENKCKEGN